MSDLRLLRVIPMEALDEELSRKAAFWDEETERVVRRIVDEVRHFGDTGLIRIAKDLGDVEDERVKLVYGRADLEREFHGISEVDRGLLTRFADRVRRFAEVQLESISPIDFQIPSSGGRAGHSIVPMESVGCYAPGGRYPLPSSVLMTVIPAVVAGVRRVVVTSPRPSAIIKAAAYIAGAESLVAVGGAQAIGALAHGTETISPVDMIVGPGNRYVVAAKQYVSRYVKIDMLAGPSECLVVADEEADPAIIAADLLAQAEHDCDSKVVLIALSHGMIDRVNAELESQLVDLPTGRIARKALENSFALCMNSMDEVIDATNRIAPEHLELHIESAIDYKDRFYNCGALFIGRDSAEVLGDYGFGPNHVLPTSGQSRISGGLSVLSFLKIRTWMTIESRERSRGIVEDAAKFARLEGLEAHARAAERRLLPDNFRDEVRPSIVEGFLSNEFFGREISACNVLNIAIPKGNMEKGILDLLRDSGLELKMTARGYRPTIPIPNANVKLLKPRNAVEMLTKGTRDIIFCGYDLIKEMNVTNATCLLDTGINPVRIVAAGPVDLPLENGKLRNMNRPYRIATEYESITTDWMKNSNIQYEIVHSYGATEVFPPEDADIIVDNTASGSTLASNNLQIIEVLLHSTTRLYANNHSLSNPAKKSLIDQIVMVFNSVLLARRHMIVEFHVLKEHLDLMLSIIPAMKKPTITKLHDLSEETFSVKSAVSEDAMQIIKLIKENGGTDIVITRPSHVVI